MKNLFQIQKVTGKIGGAFERAKKREQSTRLEELRLAASRCRKLRRRLENTLCGREEGETHYKTLSRALQREWTWQRENQQRRLWADGVYNSYFATDTGIRDLLLEFEDFLDTQQEDVETPELLKKLIQSNYIGGLAFTCSKLAPLSAPEKAVPPEGEIREAQLDFLNWKPLGGTLQDIQKQLENETLADPDQITGEIFKNEMARLSHELAAARDTLKLNLENADVWLKMPGNSTEKYDITMETAIFNTIEQLLDIETFRRLRNPDAEPDALAEDSRQFLLSAHEILLDRFGEADSAT